MNRISLFLIIVLTLLGSGYSFSFCGFYVAKADATLFNNKSEVILVRDGLKTTITMSNDYKGSLRDFAMVVPVPVVLKESDIRLVTRRVFDVLDDYSAPRLVEYYDNNPCGYPMVDVCSVENLSSRASVSFFSIAEKDTEDSGVTIEAQYNIGEYEILILSAKESNGLKDWLILNGYKIPETAGQVLQPYVKSNMKFFVVKVNLDKIDKSFEYLSPLQISFEHEKFMLPIRLGMANSQGEQDMIVYAFTREGRVECTNYRTVKMPTDRNIPLFVKPEFGTFYYDLFNKTYRNEGRNAAFLEYAWNVTPNFGGMKCDPCVGPPPIYNDFVEAGITWAMQSAQGIAGNDIFFTRLHVRYSRDKFPSDLTFQVTPNREHYQCRYVLTNPAQGDFSCEEGQGYIQSLRERRKKEVDEMWALTSKSSPKSKGYISEYDRFLTPAQKEGEKKFSFFPMWIPGDPGSGRLLFVLLFGLVIAALLTYSSRPLQKKVA